MTELERKFRLNGIEAPPGTVIGYHAKELRFLSVAYYDVESLSTSTDYFERPYVALRFSTPEELNLVGTDWPRSVAEHKGIRRRPSPYGLVRQVEKIHYPRGLIVDVPNKWEAE